MHFFDKYREDVIFLDSDTCFLKDSSYLFDKLKNGESIMYSRCRSLQEGFIQYDLSNINKISDKTKIALLFYKTMLETGMIRSDKHPISPDFYPYNSGVIGISYKNSYLLDDIWELTSLINREAFYMCGEEFAFSYFLQKVGNVFNCEIDMCIYHYADNKFCRYVASYILDLLAYNEEEELDNILSKYNLCKLNEYNLSLVDLPYFDKFLYSFFMLAWNENDVKFYVDKENCPFLDSSIIKRCKKYYKVTMRNKKERTINCMEKGLVLRHWESWNGNIVCLKSGETFSSDKLRALTEETVKTFKSINIKKGDIVALSLKNTVTFPVCLMALLYIEANPLLLSPNITGHELSHLLKIFGFKWIIRNSDLLPPQGLDKAPFEDVLTDKLLVCENRYTVSKITAKDYLVLRQDGVIIHQTSGTYGEPMLCIRNQNVAIAEAVNYVSSISAYNKIRIRITTPLNHAFSYGFGLMSTIITDSTLIMDESFNPKKVIKEETAKTSDILCVVSPMLRSFIQLKKRVDSYKLPKTIFYAGLGVQRQIADSFEKVFNNNLFTILGSTETGAISSSYGCLDNNCGVGKLLKNVEINIINKEENYQGNLVGDLKVKSTSMMQGYCLDSDYGNIDWFGTGDVATYDANGNLHIIGRKRDIINVGGIKVDPYEIEDVIRVYPGVEDCVVYSGKSQNNEEAIFVCISANSELKTTDLMHYCNNMLSQHKLPNRIIFLDKIPRTESGKCLKTLLPHYFHNPN